jgi:glycosyltransferase involved in cell wall biosynthesis
MRIAQLAPLAESVPPRGYGGSEQVVSDLTEVLIRRGHQVTLFASQDSVTQARLIPCAPSGLRQSNISATRFGAYDIKALLKLENMAGEFDIIHNHMGYSALPQLRNIACPSVTTIHNPIKDYCAEIFLSCKELPFISISDAFRRLNYGNELNYVATVHNGIDIKAFHFDRFTHRHNLLFIGRICHDKGTLEAIQIAQRVGMPLVIAGKIDNNDRQYFEEKIEPLLNDKGIKYVGEVTGKEKSTLLSSAVATLCPINFDEPFGLVFAESLASGTPVLTFRRGAAPEVVTDGQTGIVGDSIDDLVRRFGSVCSLDRDACRVRAQQLFSKESMAEKYESAYRQLLSAHKHTLHLGEVA